MNNVQLIGRLTKDVELRYFQGAQGQQAVARFTVAVDRMPKADGTREADFISCSCFGKRGEVISQHFQKGSKIGLVGRIRTGSYQNQQGVTVYTTEVEVTDLDFIDPKAAVQPNPTTPQYNMQQGQQYYAQQQPVQQPVQQKKSSGSARARSSAKSSPQMQPQNAMSVQQEQFIDYEQMPQVDEGLPFN